MKKLTPFLFMVLLIAAINACDDGGSDSGGGGHAWDLQFEVPTDYASTVTADEIYIYSLHKDGSDWHMDTVDADTSTAAVDSHDYTNLNGVDPFDAYPFDITLGAGNYLEIIKTGTADDDITSIDEYDLQDELTNDEIYQTFGYRLVATDGFTSPDMTWDVFQTGYLYESLTPLDNPRTWFPEYGDPNDMDVLPGGTDGGSWNGKYMMKMFAFVQLYRMIQIDDGSTNNNVILADYSSRNITYWNTSQTEQKTNKVIPMTDILTADTYGDLTGHTFIITAADGYVNNDTEDATDTQNLYNLDDMQLAYIVTDIEDAGTVDENPCSRGKIIFVNADTTQRHKSVKFVTTIEIVAP